MTIPGVTNHPPIAPEPTYQCSPYGLQRSQGLTRADPGHRVWSEHTMNFCLSLDQGFSNLVCSTGSYFAAGAVQCIVGYSAAPLVPTHRMPVASQLAVRTTIARHCPMPPGGGEWIIPPGNHCMNFLKQLMPGSQIPKAPR